MGGVGPKSPGAGGEASGGGTPYVAGTPESGPGGIGGGVYGEAAGAGGFPAEVSPERGPYGVVGWSGVTGSGGSAPSSADAASG